MAKSKEKVIVLGSLCIYVRTFNRSDNNTELILSNERLNNFKKFGVKKVLVRFFFIDEPANVTLLCLMNIMNRIQE